MSTASAPRSPAASHSDTFYNTQGRHPEHFNRSSLGSKSPVPSAPLHMDYSEDDVTLTQQSKRLAGLSITNFSGTKVSILNDSNSELASSPAQDALTEPPRLSLSQDSQDRITAEECTSERRAQHTQRDKNYPSHHRPHPQESSCDTGRSSSLTNASTPIYSSLELASKASQRSRSLSGGSKLSPHLTATVGAADSPSSSSASVSSPTHTHFNRSCSEDNTSDDPESYRRMSDPAHSTSGSSGTAGPTFVKRKYSCSYPGCNKCFTTSGHLARHNRIHTGERNFSCLMPGCPSRFSRQDNMMQHYRTHISPKSRRGIPKKRDYFMLDHTANHSQDGLAVFHGGMGHREQSPGGEHGKHHQHIAKMASLSRHGSRQNSPPRFNPFDRSSSVDYTARNSTESHNGGGSLRHKNSGIIQTHQHHTPLPHFNVHAHALGLAHPHPQPHQSTRATSVQGSLPSPLTPTMSQPQGYQHPSYSSRQHEQHHSSSYGSEHSYRQDAMLVSPTSPPTQDVERMDGVSSVQERQGYYARHPYSQQKPQYHSQHQSRYQNAHHSSSLPPQAHAGHAHQNGYQLPPLSLEAQERHGQLPSEKSSSNSHFHHQKQHNSTPPSPQSTPQTPTRYRFDPIQDCLQQDKQHRQQSREQYEEHNDHRSRFQSQYHDAAAEQEDTSMATTAQSSAMSSTSSMSSISSSSSSSRQGHPSQPHKQPQEPKREATEEMSGLAHLAQIVTTYG